MGRAWIAIAALGLAAAGCDQQPLTGGAQVTKDNTLAPPAIGKPAPPPDTAPPSASAALEPTPAPTPEPLPPEPPSAPIRPGAPDAAALVREAAALDRRIAAQGPRQDRFTFKHEGATAQAWRDGDIGARVATTKGTFYFHRGDAEPYLVQTKGFTYGFSKGEPTFVLDGMGRPLADADAQSHMADARADLEAGREIAQTMKTEPQPRVPDTSPNRTLRDQRNGAGTGGLNG